MPEIRKLSQRVNYIVEKKRQLKLDIVRSRKIIKKNRTSNPEIARVWREDLKYILKDYNDCCRILHEQYGFPDHRVVAGMNILVLTREEADKIRERARANNGDLEWRRILEKLELNDVL